MITKRETIILSAFSVLIVFALFTSILPMFENFPQSRKTEANAGEKEDPFASLILEAKAAVVWDARDNRVLFAKNERAQLPLASLTKIMTARIALKAGVTIAVVSKTAIEEEGDSGLLVGEKWNLPELAKLTLIASANDGANSLAAAWVGANEAAETEKGEISFVAAMNAEAKILGLKETYFLNETGLDISRSSSGAYGSALDTAMLFYDTVRMYPEVFEATGKYSIEVSSLDRKSHTITNTNGDVEKIPGIIASKTGFTDLSGGNLAVLLDAGLNHPVVLVVLGSSEKGRFEDIKKLSASTIDAVSN